MFAENMRHHATAELIFGEVFAAGEGNGRERRVDEDVPVLWEERRWLVYCSWCSSEIKGLVRGNRKV